MTRQLAIVAVMLVWLAAIVWERTVVPQSSRETAERHDGQVTIALVGDVLLAPPAMRRARDDAADAVQELLRQASLTIANLEMNFGDSQGTAASRLWVTGSDRDAQELGRIGIRAVTCANNHGADNGADTVDQTMRALDAAGIAHAGCGLDLGTAREPLIREHGGRRIAVLAATTSAVSASRATVTRPGIQPRSGVRALRYRADVTVDPSVFGVLQQAASLPNGGDGLALFGTRIRKGARTSVTFTADDDDLRDLLDDVRRARHASDIVILALHAHEPGNWRPEPAEFVRAVARRAIEAGADLVVGHGPHQLRGIEVSGAGAILYSLGNFIFHYDQLRPATADVYNGGVDLYDLAIGTVDPAAPRAMPDFKEDAWWQSAVAIAQFDGARLMSVRLHPIDLGNAAPDTRGTPRMAAADRATAIIHRLDGLSRAFGGRVADEQGIGVVTVRAPSNTGSAP
jgi:poly-gamma-glutamate synthesis protein (capsule biosynthesis protein)